MADKIDIKSEWDSISGNSLKDAITIKYCKDEEVAGGGDLDEIVSEQHAVLLEGENTDCKIDLKLAPTSAFQGFTLITECPKMEVFFGSQQEYIKTYFGDILDEFEGIRVYRFDVVISQSNVTYLSLKLIPGVQQLWIYGMLLFLRNNPMESIFSSKINLENVQNILSNSSCKLSPSAEKCKEFLQMYMSNRSTTSSPSIQSLMSMINANFEQTLSLNENTTNKVLPESDATEATSVVAEIKQHIDCKLLDIENNITEKLKLIEETQRKALQSLEANIFQRLGEIEKSQQERLDKMLILLENKSAT